MLFLSKIKETPFFSDKKRYSDKAQKFKHSKDDKRLD